MNTPNRDLFRSAIFVNPTLSSPQIPLNHSLYSQSPLHEKRPNYVSRTLYSPTLRPQSHGNNNPLGPKALTSLLTKKIDLKAQMKVVKKFKEELKTTHEDFIEGVKGFVKGLEEEIREQILGNNMMIKGDSVIVCDDLKELEKMASEESKGDVDDKVEMESRREKTKKKGMEAGLGKDLTEELARKKEEVEELRRIINEMRQSIEVQQKPKEEAKHSENIKIPPQKDLTEEGTQTKEEPVAHNKNVEETLKEQKETLQEKEHSQKNSESPEFEIISSPQNEKLLLEKEREIEKLHKSNEELLKELSQSQEKNQTLLKSLDASELKLIEKTSQFDEILKELNFHQTNPNPKNLDLEQELEKLHSSYEELTKELMDKMQENHNLMGLLESSDSKLTEKTTQYDELYKDFNSLLEEAAVRDQKLKELNDNLHKTQRLSITREEDILKLKEQLESIRKSSAFKKRAKKLSLIDEEEENNKDSGDSEDEVGSENLDNETEELKVIRLIRKDFLERKKELEVVINKKDQEIESIRMENEEYCRKISENYKEIESLKSDLAQKFASNNNLEGEPNLIENMKEELKLIKLVLDEETRKEQEMTTKFMESEVAKCQRIEELEKKDMELAQIKISLETERKASQSEIKALEHYKEQNSNEINQIKNELNETRHLLDLEVIRSQEALVKLQETTHQKTKAEEELARLSNFLEEEQRKSQGTHREMQDSQILKDQELKTLYGELDKMRESNREIQESDKAKGLGMEQLREQLVQIQVYLEAEARKYEISQKELQENGKEKERLLEEIRKLKEEICSLNEIIKTQETSIKMKETSQNDDIKRLQDEIREKSMLFDTLKQNAADEKKALSEELNKTKGLLETKTSEAENLLNENKETTKRLHEETVEVNKAMELEQKRNQETLLKYHESESLNQKLQSEITQLHEDLTKSHLSHESELKSNQLTQDQLHSLQAELTKLKHLHETKDISNQSNEELQYLNDELTKTRQLLDQETQKTQDLEARLSTELVKSEGLSHRILEITSLQGEIKALNDQLDQQSRSSIEIQKKLNKELESSREMSVILTSLTQEKLKLEDLLANKLETEIELKKSLVEVEDENELLKVRNQALDSEIHALKSEKAEVLTNLEEVQHEKENLELLLQDKLTLEIELKQNNEDYEAEIEKLKADLEASSQIKNQKEQRLAESEQLFKTQKEQLLAEKEHLETLLQEKATEEAEFKKIIESHEVELKELQQREAEYVQYITHVLNEREHEKELETTSQTASQTQEVVSAGGNKNNERIKELEGAIESLKEEHIISQTKLKEEFSIEITALKVKMGEDDREIKRLREGIEKIKIEKEEMQWKENQELVEKTNFIEKLKIENEELKKTKKIEETKKKEKTAKKSLTETIETEEREEKKKKGGVSKTVVKSVEKELQDKEQAFLEELEELKILLELVE